MIDGAPEIMLHAIYLHENLIQVPLPLSVLTHVGSSLRPDLTREDWTKSIDPSPNAFMADIYPALVEQVFNIAEGKRKPDVHHHSKLDDFR